MVLPVLKLLEVARDRDPGPPEAIPELKPPVVDPPDAPDPLEKTLVLPPPPTNPVELKMDESPLMDTPPGELKLPKFPLELPKLPPDAPDCGP